MAKPAPECSGIRLRSDREPEFVGNTTPTLWGYYGVSLLVGLKDYRPKMGTFGDLGRHITQV